MLNLNGFIPDFERVRTALRFEEPDRVPNFESFVAPKVRKGVLGRPVPDGLAGELVYRSKFGYDFLYIIPKYNKPPVYSYDAPGQTDNGRDWVDQHANIITDWQSFEAYEDYPAPDKPLDLAELRQAIIEAGKMPGKMGVGALLPACPFTEINLLMGYDNFAIALYEKPELCKAVVDKLGAVGVASAEQLAGEDIDFIFFGDDMAYTGGMMVSPEMMRELFFPWYRKFIAIARDAGKLIMFHSDGNIKPIIPDFIDAGLNALNPIEPQAMDITELKAEYYGKLALAGNIDVDLLSRGTPEAVAESVKERLKELKPGGGYLLGSSNSVCDYVKPENYAAMLNTNWLEGKYSME